MANLLFRMLLDTQTKYIYHLTALDDDKDDDGDDDEGGIIYSKKSNCLILNNNNKKFEIRENVSKNVCFVEELKLDWTNSVGGSWHLCCGL